MTPYEIEVVLWYYSRVVDHDSFLRPTGLVTDTVDAFLEWGLLQKGSMEADSSPMYKITDRGRAYVEHLRTVQLPVCKWVQPC